MATTQELIDYYADRLIIQYVGKPKAYATMQALVEGLIMDQLPTQVLNAFDLNTLNSGAPAVGDQLDILGKYAGVSRTGNGFLGPITLDDADFLSLITIAIIQNSAGSSLKDIQGLIALFFPAQMLVFDYKDMTMSYLISTSVGSFDLVQIFVNEGLLPKPMGVRLRITIYIPNITNAFGFRTYLLPGFNVSPFNSYASYQTNWPWISYANAVVV